MSEAVLNYNKKTLKSMLPSFLMQHQIDAIMHITSLHGGTKKSQRLEKLFHNTGIILADAMGLGKTYTIAWTANIQRLLDEKSNDPILSTYAKCPILIIVPKSLKKQWEAQIQELKIPNVHVIKYGNLTKNLFFASEEARFLQQQFNSIIIDEADNIRNRKTCLYQKVCQLNTMRRYAVTGTPFNNSEQDIISLYHWITCYEESGQNKKYQINQMKQWLSKCMISRTLDDANIELPLLEHQIIHVNMSQKEKELYSSVRNQEEKSQNHLVRLNKLREISTDSTMIQIECESTKMKQVCEWIKDVAIREPHSYIIVFSQWVRVLDHLHQNFVNAYKYDGRIKEEEQNDIQVQFTTNPQSRLMLASLKTCAKGLNLIVSPKFCKKQYIVFMDAWYNPCVQEQATCRAYRIGQTRPVKVIHFHCDNTIEDEVVKIRNNKQIKRSEF